MKKTIKYDLGKEAGEESISGNITFKVKKSLFSKPKIDDFTFLIKDNNSVELYEGHNKNYGRRTDDISQMDYDAFNKRLTDFGVFLSRDGNKITADKGLENAEIVKGDDGSLKTIKIDHVKFDGADGKVEYAIKADMNKDGTWSVKDSKFVAAIYVGKNVAEKNLMEYSEKLGIFQKYREKALQDFAAM